MMVPALLNIYCTIAIKYISATFVYAKMHIEIELERGIRPEDMS